MKRERVRVSENPLKPFFETREGRLFRKAVHTSIADELRKIIPRAEVSPDNRSEDIHVKTPNGIAHFSVVNDEFGNPAVKLNTRRFEGTISAFSGHFGMHQVPDGVLKESELRHVVRSIQAARLGAIKGLTEQQKRLRTLPPEKARALREQILDWQFQIANRERYDRPKRDLTPQPGAKGNKRTERSAIAESRQHQAQLEDNAWLRDVISRGNVFGLKTQEEKLGRPLTFQEKMAFISPANPRRTGKRRVPVGLNR